MRLTRMFTTDPQGHRIAYHVAGAGPYILLLHGLGGTADVWQPLVPDLAARFTVICPDLLGFGFSDKPSTALYTPACHVQAVYAVLQAVNVGHLEAVLGHSCGGVIAVTLLAEHAITASRLALVSTPYPSPRFPVRSELLRSPLDRAMLAWTPLAHLIHLSLSAVWPVLHRMNVPPELHGAWVGYLDHTVLSYVRTAEECLFRANLDPLLPTLYTLPIFLLYSMQDRTVPAIHGARLATALPQSVYQLIQGDHFALLRNGRQRVQEWFAART